MLCCASVGLLSVHFFVQEGFICGTLHKESYEEISDLTETSKRHAVVISKSSFVA